MALTAWLAASAALAQERVVFSSADAALRGGRATQLQALLFQPAGAGPFPAVVLLHGCEGLYKDGTLDARYEEWRHDLVERGYAVLLVDSLTPRGLTEICAGNGPARVLAPSANDRAHDAYGALAFLQAQSFIRADRIAAVGWSHGAAAVLWAIDEEGPTAAVGATPGFAAAVAFYPDCRATLEREPPWSTMTPLLMLGGEKDNWTPSAPCVELAKWSRLNGEPVHIAVYPDSYHAFDAPATPLATPRYEGVTPDKTIVVGTNEPARADARARVPAFLARYLLK